MRSKLLPILTGFFGEEGAEALQKAIAREDIESGSNLDATLKAMQVVPRGLLAWVTQACKSIPDSNHARLYIPNTQAALEITRIGTDLYTGTFEEAGKIIHRFNTLSIPQLAAHVMTVFEMYQEEPEEIAEEAPSEPSLDWDRSVLARVLGMMEQLIQIKAVEQAPIQEVVIEQPVEQPEVEMPVFDSHSYRAGYYMTLANFFRKTNAVEDAKLADEKLEENIKKVGYFSDMNRMEFEKGARFAVECIKNDQLGDRFEKEEAKSTIELPDGSGVAVGTISKNDELTKNDISNRCLDCGSKIVISEKFVGCPCLDLKKGVDLIKTETGYKLQFSKAWSNEAITLVLNKLKETRLKCQTSIKKD